MFDCDGCPVAEQLDGLDARNCYVWNLYRKTVVRLAADLHAGGAVLSRLTADLSQDDFDDVWRRLVMLYNTIDPPPEPAKE